MASRLDPYALIGARLRDRYLVEAFAGIGRFSAVYRATDTLTERPVALRLLKVKDALTAGQRTIVVERLRSHTRSIHEVASRCPSFSDLTEIASLVTSDGVTSDGVISEGRWMPVVVQSWIEGETLESVLAREKVAGIPPRSLATAIDLLTPVADALGYAHARGLVHGSLSPRTLLVRDVARDGGSAVGILDLGLAQALSTTQERDRPFARPAHGALHFFAPTHGSPEHFERDMASLEPASDVFVLALIVAELVSGAPPLGDGDDDQLRAAALDPVSRPTSRGDLGGYVEAVFARAFTVRASDRFASVSAFWEALRAASRMTALRPSARASRPPPIPTGFARAREAAPASGVRELHELHFAQQARRDASREDGVPQSAWPEGAPQSPRDRAFESRRERTPPPGFFETAPQSSIPGTNPLFAGEPRGRARAE